jgi:GT2 family glycosyltransferase
VSKLTALMPVKGWHGPFLADAVGSMLAQTSADWRLIVIAEEPEAARLRPLLPPDERIEVVVNRGRKLAGAFNTGMRAAATEYVAILLGDDLWAPQAVEVLERNIEKSPATDFFHSSRRIVDEEGRPVSTVHRSRTDVVPEDFLTSSPVKHLLCWRRAAGLAIGGMDESLNSVGVDDYDFPWSMAEQGASFRAVPECLYVYRDHRAAFRLTTHLTVAHHKRELARILRKHGAGEAIVAARVAEAERTWLRQCLYRSRLDRWRKSLLGGDARVGWRETYA